MPKKLKHEAEEAPKEEAEPGYFMRAADAMKHLVHKEPALSPDEVRTAETVEAIKAHPFTTATTSVRLTCPVCASPVEFGKRCEVDGHFISFPVATP